MHLVCLDLEGVLIPEIWIAIAEHAGVEELRVTTREIPDFDELMESRLAILRKHNIRMEDIETVLGHVEPLPGATSFFETLRGERSVIILSDTFSQFSKPLLRKLGFPTIFCNELVIGADGFVESYTMRQKDGKSRAVRGLQAMGFTVSAAGDSYNDIGMLEASEKGVLFRAPAKIHGEYPDLWATESYDELIDLLLAE
jgi:phosphoserine/homoserine phosphotransferase